MNKKIVPYLIGYLMMLLIGCGLLVAYPKAELHLMLNENHTVVGDVFFKYYTVLAEWPLYVIALIPLCFKKWRWTLYYAISEGVAAIIIRLLKITFSAPRPVAYFDTWFKVQGSRFKVDHLPLVDGVTMHHSNSFPSGHASTFFLFFTFTALLLCSSPSTSSGTSLRFQKTSGFRFQVILFVLLALATLGCYSRIYLSQHFLSDVCAGSLVGVLVPCIMFYFFGKKITA